MDITYRKERGRWIIEVWKESYPDKTGQLTLERLFDEDLYVQINDWCLKTFGYHARTAYHVFEIKKENHLNWFLIRWSGD